MNPFFSFFVFSSFAFRPLHLILCSLFLAVGVQAQSETSQLSPEILPVQPVLLQPAQMQPEPVKPMTWGQAFDKHAPLAFFSAGSLAVGGLIATIRSDRDTPANMRGNLSGGDVAWALGLSGGGALVAGMAFWYYAHTEVTRDIGATLDAGQSSPDKENVGFAILPTFDGKLGLAASLALPF
jgi:hypothetical protein